MYSIALLATGFVAGVAATLAALMLIAEQLSPSAPGDGLEKYGDD